MIKLQFDQNTSQNIWDQYGNVIRYDLQEAMQSSKLNDMFELFFPNYFEIHDKCKVSFLSPKEMKCHENRRNDVEVRKNAVALIEKILATCDEKFFFEEDLIRRLNNVRRTIETGKDEEGNSPNGVMKQMNYFIKEFIQSISEGNYMREEDRILIKLLKELQNLLKMIQFDMILFGCYNHKNSTIYLCLENIEKSAIEKGYEKHLFVEIAKSVLVHEYTHCIHLHYIKQRQRTIENAYSRIKKEAVMETVSECIQNYYLENILQCSRLNSWIPNHSKSGAFPAWGYGGEEIVRNYCERNGRTVTEILKKEIQISKWNWRRAYSFLDAIEMLNES